ncbi:amino acid transporter [Grosmannia clavigera kw1407]|uniref:Amino acid transporter n=1 Tax=Grosmannia clavigera (strain kw1407 / UAMH 11150) TaxID=655863 RepID=F0XDD9_GROCL|nr:amino acid transporter [Grosmannia clavigera kw1407]EFX04795.1 amino acid transporter [Grosmannia clavigera kw1407]
MATLEKGRPETVSDSIEPNMMVGSNAPSLKGEAETSHEVFKDSADGVNFRTVSWQSATVVFLKIQFAMSILSVPGSLSTLGAVGGSLSIVGWEILNTYTALILGEFRDRHPECHTLADMCGHIWGQFGKELVGFQIIVAQVLISAGGIVSVSTAFNALSDHGACTVWFGFVASVLITLFSSVRTFSRLSWLTWFGFSTFFISVFIFVVAVTQQNRPAAAPQTGDYDLGYVAVASPGFVAGIMASSNIFISGSGSSMYLPVISEMRRPQDYRKAALVASVLIGAMYLTFSLVIYRWCGVWLTTPVFGSAGTLFKKLCYGIALPGLVIGVGIYQHVAAKYMFVRILRNSVHLQTNTVVHWSVWLGCNLSLGIVGFVIAEAVPILNYLLSLASALCFAPFSLTFPVMLWMYDFKGYRSGSAVEKSKYAFHIVVALVGVFMLVGGIYGVAMSLKEAYADGLIGGAFSCADNSGYISS